MMSSWQVALLEELQKVSQGHDGEGMLGCILMHFVLAVTCCYSVSFNDQKIKFTHFRKYEKVLSRRTWNLQRA